MSPTVKVELNDEPGVILGNGDELYGVRESVARFAVEMETVLSEHDQEKGDRGWLEAPRENLLNKLEEEYNDLRRSIELGYAPVDIAGEAADLANICMMLRENYGGPTS